MHIFLFDLAAAFFAAVNFKKFRSQIIAAIVTSCLVYTLSHLAMFFLFPRESFFASPNDIGPFMIGTIVHSLFTIFAMCLFRKGD